MLYNQSLLEEQFELFKSYIYLNDKQQRFTDFSHPYYIYREGYMDDLLRAARAALAVNSWKAESIGTGKILECLINASEVDGNNLFIQDGRYGEDKRKQQIFYNANGNTNETRRIEKLFYEFYHNLLADEKFFEKLSEEPNLDYRFVCYWFFLKDNERYNPIAQRAFNQICEKIGCPVRLTSNKSWQDYIQLNEMISQVRDWLSAKLGMSVSMIEAHGFLWILTYEEFPDGIYKNINNYYRLSKARKNSKLWRLMPVSGLQPSYKEEQEEFDLYKTSEQFLEEFKKRQEIGLVSEDLAIAFERKRLTDAGRPDLANRINTERRFNPKLGYDIQSFELKDESKRLIEVKTVRKKGSDFYAFFISANELKVAMSSDIYWFYLVENPMNDNFSVSAIKASDILNKELLTKYLSKSVSAAMTLQPLQFLLNFRALQLE